MTLDVAFGNWLAGFFDGEGCFSVKEDPRGGFQCMAIIQLRLDDLPILNEIQHMTGIGRIYLPRNPSLGRERPTARWSVHNKTDCLTLCGILDVYALRAKKARDYAIWREAVRLHAGHPQHRRREDWTAMRALSDELRRIRGYDAGDELLEPKASPQLKLSV